MFSRKTWSPSTDGGRRILEGPNLFAAGHAVGLSEPGAERGPFLPRRRRSLDRPPDFAGRKPMLRTNGRLLPGAQTTAREVLLRRGLFGRSRVGRQGRSTVAVERSTRLHVRWHDGHDARHAGKPRSLSASLQSEAGPGFPDRAHRSHHLLVLRGHLESRDLPVRRQGTRRGQLAPHNCGTCFGPATFC